MYGLRFDQLVTESGGLSVQGWYTSIDAASQNPFLTLRSENVELCASWVWHLGETPLDGPWWSAGVTAGQLDELFAQEGVTLVTKGIVVGPRVQLGHNWVGPSGLLFGLHLGLALEALVGTMTSTNPALAPATDMVLDLNGLLHVGYAW